VSEQARIAELEAKLARLEALMAEQVAARDARIAELEKLLAESRRSGKRQAAPFSKGEPSESPARPGRKRGKGHGRHGHRMPLTDPDRMFDAPLSGCCPGCGGAVVIDRIAEQWQIDLPDQPAAVVTRFDVAIGHCSGCGRRVQGRHPEQTSDALGAAGSQVGPRAKAWAAWLHYGLGLSFGKCTQLLARLGVNVTAGALCSAAQSTGTALVPVHTAITRRVNDAEMVVMDETGWRVDGASAWLWVATTVDATVYDVADGRGYEQACRLVDADYDGMIVRDGWAPYRRYTAASHQTCLAHLLRRCHELCADVPAWARHTPRTVADILTSALDARDLPDSERAAVVADLTERIELLAEDPHPHDECRKLVAHLTRETDALFSFLTHPGVDATNWRGEQAIRPAVVNRKVWGGNRTWRGAATQSRIMSVLRTAVQQGVDPIAYLAGHARAPASAALFS
jgi:transposase